MSSQIFMIYSLLRKLYCCVLIYNKKKFHSLLSLDWVHWSDVIAGNVTSSTCSERTSLPPVALTEERRIEREMEVGIKPSNIYTLCRPANKDTQKRIRFIGCVVLRAEERAHKTNYKTSCCSAALATEAAVIYLFKVGLKSESSPYLCQKGELRS